MKTDVESIEVAPLSPRLLKGAHTSSKANMNSYRSTSSNQVERDTKRESQSIASKVSANKKVITTLKGSLSPSIAKISQRVLSKRQNIKMTNTLQNSLDLSAKKANLLNKNNTQVINPEYDSISPEVNGYSATSNLDQSFGMNNSYIQSADNFTQKVLVDNQLNENPFINNNDEEHEDDKEEYQDQIITSIRIIIII